VVAGFSVSEYYSAESRIGPSVWSSFSSWEYSLRHAIRRSRARRERQAIAGIGRPLGQQEREWKAALADLDKRAKPERNKVSGLKKVPGNLETKHEQLQATVAGIRVASDSQSIGLSPYRS
jgi:hypothetical protein